MTATAGYLLMVYGESGDSDGMRHAAVVVLAVGTPLVTTFSDRVFRALR
jgi:hypothetical protein